MIQHAADVLQKGRRFLVTCHLNPDGDAIGSMLALVHLLQANGKEAVAFHTEPVPGPYRFLSGVAELSQDEDLVGPFDVMIVVDVGERERLPEKLPKSVDQALVLVIDHHRTHGELGDVVWRRRASSVGEMVVELARYMDWAVSVAFAECAYTAILTDTGSFHYASTSESSLEAASFLLSQGVQPWKVASNVYESWPACRVQLLGDVIGTLRLHCEDQFASLVVSRGMLAARGATVDMTEGFVNQGRRIEGVEVSALFRELAPDKYRISFRSRGRVDVSAIAVKLNGGGHRNASGATAGGSLESVRNRVTQLVEKALQALDPDDQNDWSHH